MRQKSHWEISISCTIQENNFYSIICQLVAYERLKTIENFKLSALKVVAVAYERWPHTKGSKYRDLTCKFGKPVTEEGWSLKRGGRNRWLDCTWEKKIIKIYMYLQKLYTYLQKIIFLFYAEKSSNYAEDADVNKLRGSAPLHPVRCPEKKEWGRNLTNFVAFWHFLMKFIYFSKEKWYLVKRFVKHCIVITIVLTQGKFSDCAMKSRSACSEFLNNVSRNIAIFHFSFGKVQAMFR